MKARTLLFLVTLLAIELAYTMPYTMPHIADGANWSPPIQLTDSQGFDNYPSILQARDGKVWLVWDSDRAGRWGIFYKTNDLVSWSPELPLTSESLAERAPSITQLANETIIVAYGAYVIDNYDLYYKSWNGTAWSRPRPLVVAAWNDAAPSLSESPDGTMWLVWERRLNEADVDVYYKTLKNGVWSPDMPLVTGSKSDLVPSVLALRNGRVLVAWTRVMSGSNYDIYYKTFDSGQWSSEYPLTTSRDLEMRSAITQDRDGRLWLFWSRELPASNQNYQDEIYYKWSTDGYSWSGEAPLTSDPSNQVPIQDTAPAVVQGPDRRLWIVWASDLTDDWEIYMAKSDPILIHDVALRNLTVLPWRPRMGEKTNIIATVENMGDFSETFQVQLYVDSVLLKAWSVSLLPQQSLLLTYNWQVDSDKPSQHHIQVSIPGVAGETSYNLSSNSASASVSAVLPGDVDRDGGVNIDDISMAARAYGSVRGTPLYNPNADLDYSGSVDIDDMAKVALWFGKQV